MYATQQVIQRSHSWYHFLKGTIAILFECMKIFKFCKRYVVTYYTYIQSTCTIINMVKLFFIGLQVPSFYKQTPSIIVRLVHACILICVIIQDLSYLFCVYCKEVR